MGKAVDWHDTVFHEAAATKTAAAFVQTKTTTTNPKGDKMSEEKAKTQVVPAAEAKNTSIHFSPTGSGWDNAADAQAWFRQQQLDTDKWAVAKSPRGDGYCIMTFRALEDLRRAREEEARATASAQKAPMKYHKVRIGTSADSDKKDMLTLPIGLNGMFTSLMLNSQCFLSEAQIEVLENARTENWVPLPDGGPDGKTFVKRGLKDRINYSILGPATQKEWSEYQAKNKTRFDSFVAEQASKDHVNDPV